MKPLSKIDFEIQDLTWDIQEHIDNLNPDNSEEEEQIIHLKKASDHLEDAYSEIFRMKLNSVVK